MISLLRRIRRSLIETLPAREGTAEQAGGSARKYMLYAIGEIALVVIGILIALQINNWNIQRQEIALGEVYLQRIKQELLENIELTDSHIRWEISHKAGLLPDFFIQNEKFI